MILNWNMIDLDLDEGMTPVTLKINIAMNF